MTWQIDRVPLVKVYINIACNLAGETHPTFTEEPIPFAIYPKVLPMGP